LTSLLVTQHATATASAIGRAMIEVQSAASAVAAANTPKTGWDVTPDALANGFATLIGALLGALVAYTLQRRINRTTEENHERRAAAKEATDTRRADLIAAHHINFCLFQQINTILLIQKDYIYDVIDDPTRFISIPATQMFDENRFTFTIQDLQPLFKTPERRKQIHDLFLAQENYMSAVAAWNLRSQLHNREVQPKLGAADVPNGGMVSWAQIEAALGPVTFPSIINMTNGVQQAIQRAYNFIEKQSKEFVAYMKKEHPDEKFSFFETIDNFRITQTIKEIVSPGPPSNLYASTASAGYYNVNPSTVVGITPTMMKTSASMRAIGSINGH
jgi:hypothetical protein